jgi:hypothetical protein
MRALVLRDQRGLATGKAMSVDGLPASSEVFHRDDEALAIRRGAPPTYPLSGDRPNQGVHPRNNPDLPMAGSLVKDQQRLCSWYGVAGLRADPETC